jgi:protein-tyrosine phosphatase
MKILMVCLGNICRSPLAEGIMRDKIERAGLDWEVDSAGTGTWHIGHRPDKRSIAEAQKHGLDIQSQRGRQIQPSDLKDFDLIFAMDESNYRDILSLTSDKQLHAKVQKILDISENGRKNDVPDPYWDDNGFARVYTMLEKACESIIERYSRK